ncbi:MAG TPA: 23S rRNA (pseudouridine(1915)-N(3))-methyltransferase RlmH, partial [Bacteroidales bacterium]|nr:23S rRNA (pseudouridine(1915)-N(3))-methyltransferase RlmH [Bacteroidales bacterium]
MKITLLCVGKTDNKHLESLINDYVKRLSKSIGFSVEYIEPRNVKKLKARELKKAEGELILQKLIKSQRTI